MNGEIIAIGDELTSGRVLNTNSRFAAGQLFTAGHEIVAMSTIGDSPAEIGQALKRASKRADFVVVTGGLGATSDDVTNEAVAKALARPVELFPEILARINGGGQLHGQSGNRLEKLAWLPAGAEVLQPEARMAGYLLVHDETPIFFLPGVPHEMRQLLAERVIPRLALWQGGGVRQVRQRVYKIFGMAEIDINRLLVHLETDSQLVRIGYYPVFPEVHLSVTVINGPSEAASSSFDRVVAEIETLLDDRIIGRDDDTMEGVVGQLLLAENKMLAVAESCTGGLIAHKITSVAGSSGYFAGGVVAYSNDMKQRFLGVEPRILAQHGAVSGPVARQMAVGMRTRAGVDFAVAVTGIAGPGGGSPEKPVGTVHVGLATPDDTMDFRCRFSGDRWQIQEMTAMTALDTLRRVLLNRPFPG